MTNMPPPGAAGLMRRLIPVRIASAMFWVLLMAAIAIAGGLLNRARGGMHPFTQYSYWSAHIRSRLLMAGPTGALVLLMTLHVRASLVIFLMTWFSLYTGWGTYFNIGNSPTAYLSRAGVFDWALGRSQVNWTYHQNFMREYTGMSLRGLLWTGPAGYAVYMLGLGWHYSLAGSWMGLVYYLGGRTPNWDVDYAERNLDGQIAWSELYWGWWIWFMLELTCVSYVIKAVRKRYGTNDTRNDALDLIHIFWSGCYEIVMFIINIIFACSVGFYQLVQQKDMKNKGQTFFGLFTGVLFLTFAQAFNWGYWWSKYQNKRKRRRHLVRSGSISTINTSVEYTAPNNETTPLLPWPQSHPNANQPSNGIINTNHHGDDSHQGDEDDGRRYEFSRIWSNLEVVIHLDSFLLLRWFLGVLSALHTILVLIAFVLCIIVDSNSPRLMPYYRILTNQTADDFYDYDY